jgi:hypothetical protein
MLYGVSAQRWGCCYVLVENRSPRQVAALLSGTLSGRNLSGREAHGESVAWPSIGPAVAGWTLVVDPHQEFGDADDELRVSSAATRIARLVLVGEPDPFSYASVWNNGSDAWSLSFDRIDDEPVIGGALPDEIDELRRALGAGDRHGQFLEYAEAAYQLAISAVGLVTGWRYDPQDPRGDDTDFAEFTYPRPVGVTASVAADLRRDEA